MCFYGSHTFPCRSLLLSTNVLNDTYIYIIYVVVQDPVDTIVCQDDDATFTCVIFILSGTIIPPGWLRNGVNADMTRHTIVNNLTGDDMTPVYVSSTLTVNSVTVLDDDGVLYQCDILSIHTTNNATLTVVGMQVYNYVLVSLFNVHCMLKFCRCMDG